MEQSMGHLTNNILTVLQRERNVSLQEAAVLVGVHWSRLVEIFEKAKAELPSFGEGLDPLIAYVTRSLMFTRNKSNRRIYDRNHVTAMESWVAGNLDWSFATPRYFGAGYERVRETLAVHLTPPKNI